MTDQYNDEKLNGGILKQESETYNTPLNISDILIICQEYNQLGWNIQRQIEHMLEVGIEEAISDGSVSVSVLPLIRDFLQCIAENSLFGDASDTAYGVMMMLDNYEMKHPQMFVRSKN